MVLASLVVVMDVEEVVDVEATWQRTFAIPPAFWKATVVLVSMKRLERNPTMKAAKDVMIDAIDC